MHLSLHSASHNCRCPGADGPSDLSGCLRHHETLLRGGVPTRPERVGSVKHEWRRRGFPSIGTPCLLKGCPVSGGLHVIAELIHLDQETHGPQNDPVNMALRRYAGMAMTNLTYGDVVNKVAKTQQQI